MCHHDREELAEWAELHATEEDDPLAEFEGDDEGEPDAEEREPATPPADD